MYKRQLEFEYAWKTTAGAKKFQGIASDYTATFLVDDGGRSSLKGSVSDNFGYNALLKQDIQEGNYREIEDRKVDLHLRRRPFPWSPPKSISDELTLYFVSVQGEHSSDGRSIFDRSNFETIEASTSATP